ncbi:MAG: MarR family transcriptional regulator [Methanotrichaceae archaeon]
MDFAETKNELNSLKIEHLPPSAKLVFKVLESGAFLTQKDIVAETYLPPRTVRYALDRLKEQDILQERFYFQDARQSLFGLVPDAVEVVAE